MVVPASADTREDAATFVFSTPEYRLTGHGVRAVVAPRTWGGADVAAAVEELLHRGGHEGPVVGCIPFDTSRPAVLYVPEDVTWRHGAGATGTDGSDGSAPAASSPPLPDSPGYREAVRRAVERIDAGELEKVVLARTAVLEADRPFDIDRLVGDLGAANPHAYIYRTDLGDVGTLVGASPELVLRSRKGAVTSFPLAGSVPRDHGNPELDRELTRRLLASPKDRAEHGHVVHQVGEVFRRHAENVVVPEEPGVVATPVILHLGSRVTGRLPGPNSPAALMEMLYDLHPTPAVCGWPTPAARAVIDDLEDFDRGMYSGLVGWVDAEGNGEWALSLRGGVVTGERARLFAGAGIVSGSVPEDEHRETATKFATFARVLQNQQRRTVTV
ncbi:isochorismate synthase [Corynebacterium kalidii]|uniref:isochorismate synthase n=1 Tax=Corynebacterium kalidii TaxID=2931982 RepID=A0A9X1WEZ9_9CORY|nr:isochorismate synthase [Corynebacterium kalidii]MCJ7857809.1 isochorismate synthase [Corynebacterium kalidii]